MERIAYDEFGLFHENAEEFGLPYDGPPTVRRERGRVDGRRAQRARVGDGRARARAAPRRGPERPHVGHGGAGARRAAASPSTCPATGTPTGRATDGGLARRTDNAEDVAVAVRAARPERRAVVGMSLGGHDHASRWPATRPSWCARLRAGRRHAGRRPPRRPRRSPTSSTGPQSFAELRRPARPHDRAQPDAHRVVAAPRHPAQRRPARRRQLAVELRPQQRTSPQ